MALSDFQCKTLFESADEAGTLAADSIELPVVTLQDSDVFGNLKPDGNKYSFSGLCGFAVVHFPANTRFSKWAVLVGIARKDSYHGGLRMNVFQFNQSYDKKVAYASAFANVLLENGIKKVWVEDRLD